MYPPKIGTHVRLDSMLKMEAKAYAAHAPMTFQMLVERAIREYLDRHAVEKVKTDKENPVDPKSL